MVNHHKQWLLLASLVVLLSVVFIVSAPTVAIIAAPEFSVTATPTQYARLVVTKLEDTGDGLCDPDDCSLREAIGAIKSEGTITLRNGLKGIITIKETLVITKATTIVGSGPKSDALIIKVTTGNLAFNIMPTGRLVLKLLTVTGNDFFISGGGVNVNKGHLAILQSTFSANKHSTVFNNRGTVIIEQSTFANNQSTNGGAIENYLGKVTIRNSTFFGNKATGGGAISNYGDMTIEFSTFSRNEGLVADNIESHPAGQLKISNTILLARNKWQNCEGAILDYGNNLQFPTNDCGESIQIADPMMLSLEDNGGPTLTIALQADSPAVDAGNDGLCEEIIKLVDQRGFSRRQGKCDIGAYEKQ